ncbi:MAG: hypothetical protein A2Z25_24585 [Planctomycetes bacterium RBG_16_55_9]|nr:MAG: hypothetical protein A2Z25_24585 [Planctomycetes bacterium RBG_16_55_9]
MKNIGLLYFFAIPMLLTLPRVSVMAEAQKDPYAEVERQVGEWHRAMVAAKDRSAEQEYAERNAQIAPRVEDIAPLNPDNAALLYYQAFLLRPEPNAAVVEKIHDIFFDAQPDRQIRIYLGHCLPMIQMAEVASQIPQCTWGIGSERALSESALRTNVGHLYYILLVDARTLAVDGHYQAALECCLTVRRLARHLVQDSELDLFGTSPDLMALRTVQHVLGIMPPDAEILTWLRGQLAVVPGPQLSFAETLRERVQRYLYHMRTTPVSLRHFKNLAVEKAKSEQAKQNIRELTDEQFLSRVHDEFGHLTDTIFRIVDSDMTYEQKQTQLQGSIGKLLKDNDADPIMKVAISAAGMGMDYELDRHYPFLVGHQAHINGIKAAAEVYLVLAKTGRLPEKLPDYLPKDPFTGHDFVYEITDEGFALRCQGEEFLRRKNRFLEFKVKK